MLSIVLLKLNFIFVNIIIITTTTTTIIIIIIIIIIIAEFLKKFLEKAQTVCIEIWR